MSKKDIFDLYPEDKEQEFIDQQLLHAISNIFNNDDGELVLKWISAIGGLEESSFNSDPMTMANIVGRQDLARDIYDMFKLSQERGDEK